MLGMGVTDQQVAAMTPEFQAQVVELLPGDLLVMDGNLVHAGFKGEEGYAQPRFHWYV